MKAQTKAELKAEINRLNYQLTQVRLGLKEMERTHKAEVVALTESTDAAGFRFHNPPSQDSFWYWLGYTETAIV
jgi:hypothetical protein